MGIFDLSHIETKIGHVIHFFCSKLTFLWIKNDIFYQSDGLTGDNQKSAQTLSYFYNDIWMTIYYYLLIILN